MKKILNYNLLLAAVSFACVSSSQAALAAYEGFDYTAGALGSASGGTGWASNWSSNSSTNAVSSDLAYGSLITEGGSIGNLTGGQNRLGASRDVDLASAGLLTGELWFSAMMGYDIAGNRTNSSLMLVIGDEAMSTGNFDYNYNTAGATGLGVMLGRNTSTGSIRGVQARDTTFGSSGFAGNVNGTNAGVGLASTDGANNLDYRLVVGRITWGVGAADDVTNDDTIDIFLPGADLVQGAVHSTLTVNVDQSGFDNLTFKRGDKVVLDEIRIGSSYLDVVPVPEPSSTALLGLGGLALILRRRR